MYAAPPHVTARRVPATCTSVPCESGRPSALLSHQLRGMRHTSVWTLSVDTSVPHSAKNTRTPRLLFSFSRFVAVLHITCTSRTTLIGTDKCECAPLYHINPMRQCQIRCGQRVRANRSTRLPITTTAALLTTQPCKHTHLCSTTGTPSAMASAATRLLSGAAIHTACNDARCDRGACRTYTRAMRLATPRSGIGANRTERRAEQWREQNRTEQNRKGARSSRARRMTPCGLHARLE